MKWKWTLMFVLACGGDASVRSAQPEAETETEAEAEAEAEVEAETEAEDVAPEVRCTRDDECVPARDACNGLVGVRRDHATDYEARMAQLRPVVDCEGIGESQTWGELRGYCHESRCIAGDSAKRCTGEEQCMKIEGACGMWDVVHRDFQAQVREGFNRRAAVISCMAGTRAPEVDVECRAGLCIGTPTS